MLSASACEVVRSEDAACCMKVEKEMVSRTKWSVNESINLFVGAGPTSCQVVDIRRGNGDEVKSRRLGPALPTGREDPFRWGVGGDSEGSRSAKRA